MTDYLEVLFSGEAFWPAADRSHVALGGMNSLGFCPHHCIPGMPFTGLSKII